MSYKLIYSSHSESDVKIIEGRLTNEGFDVRLDYKHDVPTKTMALKLFGIYVPEQDVVKAQSLLNITYPIEQKKFKTQNLQMAAVFVLILIFVLIFIITSIK